MSEEFNMPRKKAAIMETIGIIFFGIFCALSFGVLSDVKLFGLNIFDIFDWTSSKIFLPIGGLFISLFTGWYLDRKLFKDELTNYGATRAHYLKVIIFMLRYIVPLAIIGIILNQFGVLALLK
jgi:NSS family neurotransmitter:Na+ symporter